MGIKEFKEFIGKHSDDFINNEQIKSDCRSIIETIVRRGGRKKKEHIWRICFDLLREYYLGLDIISNKLSCKNDIKTARSKSDEEIFEHLKKVVDKSPYDPDTDKNSGVYIIIYSYVLRRFIENLLLILENKNSLSSEIYLSLKNYYNEIGEAQFKNSLNEIIQENGTYLAPLHVSIFSIENIS